MITIKPYSRGLIGVLAGLYFIVHGIFAVGVMPGAAKQGWFELCHQNLGARQLMAVSHASANTDQHAHHFDAQIITAESACDIGFFLEQWSADSTAAILLTSFFRPQVLSNLAAQSAKISSAFQLAQPRAPPVSR